MIPLELCSWQSNILRDDSEHIANLFNWRREVLEARAQDMGNTGGVPFSGSQMWRDQARALAIAAADMLHQQGDTDSDGGLEVGSENTGSFNTEMGDNDPGEDLDLQPRRTGHDTLQHIVLFFLGPDRE